MDNLTKEGIKKNLAKMDRSLKALREYFEPQEKPVVKKRTANVTPKKPTRAKTKVTRKPAK